MADPTARNDFSEAVPAGAHTPRRLAVLGSPIAHSLSPALHDAAYRALGLPWQYTATRIEAHELDGFLAGLTPEWLGLSLTMPLKHQVQSRLGELDRVATLTGAVNTVRIGDVQEGGVRIGDVQGGDARIGDGQGGDAQIGDGREGDARIGDDPATGSARPLTGYNTDVPGLVRALAEAGVDRAVRVTLLGAGATAASALVAAAELGAETVDIIARTPERADVLVDLGHRLGLVVTVSGLAALADPDRLTDLVISTLPGDAELGTEFPALLRTDTLLFDVGYAPWPTALASSWAAAGGRALSGRTMLLHQALIQVRIFVGNDPFLPLPNEAAVLQAMRAALPADPVPGDGRPGRPVEG
jgi:shikimate dehydrogenase